MARARRGCAQLCLVVALVACGGPPSTTPMMPAALEEPSETPSQATPDVPGGGERGEAPAPTSGPALPDDARSILAAHNRARASHCARPLVWSTDLAGTAQAWATELAERGCAFEHSQTAYGENLAAGTELLAAGAVDLWYREAAHYNFRRQGFSMQTGHFTQLVWQGTRSLGCGSSECQGMRIWVCHYDPPGNVLSMFADNVLPTTCQ